LGADPVERFDGERGNHPGGPLPGQQPAGRREGPSPADAAGMGRRTRRKWTYYYLYVILDIYSRYAVGWMLATRESAVLAEKLIADTAAKQGISRAS